MPDNYNYSPLVTVVIPCYQQQAFLRRALQSLKEQTFSHLEVIVIDDGSEPAIHIPTDFNNVTLIRQENAGLSAARNTGLEVASGDFIKFLDADDALTPRCIELQVASLRNKADTISCIAFEEVNEVSGMSNQIYPAFRDPLSAISLINFGPPHIYLYKTEHVRETGGFAVSERVRGGHEDYDLVFRLIVGGKDICTVHDTGAVYYKRPGSMSSKQHNMNRTRALVWLYNASTAIRANRILTEEQLLSFLVGMVLVLQNTEGDIRKDFAPVLHYFNEKLAKTRFKISNKEMNALKHLLDSEPETRVFSSQIKTISDAGEETEASKMHLTDPRFYLKDREITFPDNYLIRVLVQAKKYNHRFALFGITDSGRSLLEILKAAGIFPALVTDFGWQCFTSVEDLKVEAPASLAASTVELVVISPDSDRASILPVLSEICPDIEIV